MDTVVRRFTPDDQQPVRALVLAGLAEQWGFTITHVTDGPFGSDTWFAMDLRNQR